MILIRKRPDGLFERVLPDGKVDLFTLAEDREEGEAGVGLAASAGIRSEAAAGAARRLDS